MLEPRTDRCLAFFLVPLLVFKSYIYSSSSVLRVGGVGFDKLLPAATKFSILPAQENDGQCHPCHPGYMSSEGGTCRACVPGTFALRASSRCESCPLGAVAEEAGSSACMACPAGKHEARRQFCSICPPGTMSAAGSGSCTSCRAGYHAMSSGSSVCETCAAGTFSEEGSFLVLLVRWKMFDCKSDSISYLFLHFFQVIYWQFQGLKCSTCSPGTVSEAASEACSPCKAGQIARSSLNCEPCPSGTYAPARSTICRDCPHGQVSSAESSSCQPCESVWLRVLPDDRRERCTVSALDVAFALTAWITIACFVAFFLVGCYSKLPLEDFSLQGDKLVATTSLPHSFLKWNWASPAVYFMSTGVPDLDSGASSWKGRAQNIDELTLQSEKSIDRPLDTSMGFLHVKFPMAFIMTGLFGFPLLSLSGWF